MSTSWAAGVVRARAMAQRRIGAGAARELALSPGLPEAVSALHATPYGHDVEPGMGLAEAQHAVGAALLWNLRVLAGWLPRGGVQAVRLLAAGFEVANLDEHLAVLYAAQYPAQYSAPPGSRSGPALFDLGSLETAWSRLRATTTVGGVAEVLGTTPWRLREPQGRRDLRLGMRLSWADAVTAGVPAAGPWARAAAALLLLREVLVEGEGLSPLNARRATSLLGPAFVGALQRGQSGVPALRRDLPADSRWVLDALDNPEGLADLWRAEAAWWRRVERDGFGLLRGSSFDGLPVVGAAAVLAADAWRVRAALEVAARAGTPSVLEVFDGVA